VVTEVNDDDTSKRLLQYQPKRQLQLVSQPKPQVQPDTVYHTQPYPQVQPLPAYRPYPYYQPYPDYGPYPEYGPYPYYPYRPYPLSTVRPLVAEGVTMSDAPQNVQTTQVLPAFNLQQHQ